MTDITMESLMEKMHSRYKLVVLAAKRTLELSEGKEKLTDISPNVKLSAIAIKEIQEGKISYKVKEEKSA
ncbi:MAG: DNA-directed RNA polymerase subunit omega [Candidatus Omnitrophica bacterium]|nr:DNA-directed RNA polymerase subunit omega [Candidatus Omnitrophota bacterium]